MSNQRWDINHRRTGRTTRMLAEAFRRAYNGETVTILAPGTGPTGFFEYCIPILMDMGACKANRACVRVDVGYGPKAGRIFFRTRNDELFDRETMTFRGTPGTVLYDHEAIRQMFQRCLEMYHEWD